MWWPLTLTYIFKVIWPWLWKSCPLCKVFSSRSIISIFATENHYHLRVCHLWSLWQNSKILIFRKFFGFHLVFWLGIWYELVNSMDLGFKMNWSIVWVIMGRRGVSSERRRSSCSSYIIFFHESCKLIIIHINILRSEGNWCHLYMMFSNVFSWKKKYFFSKFYLYLFLISNCL